MTDETRTDQQSSPATATVAAHITQDNSQDEGKNRQEERKLKSEQEQKRLIAQKEKIEALSEGVFRSWDKSPIGWILGGGTALALVDFWVRWWTMGM